MIELQGATRAVDEEFVTECLSSLEKVLKYDHVGFLKILEDDRNWTESEEFGRKIAERFSRLVVIGIGGSALGARTIVDTLSGSFRGRQVDFLENVDARYFWDFLRSVDDFSDVAWLVVSKSGGTIETLSFLDFVSQHLSERNIEIQNSSFVITEDAENPLANWARENGVPMLATPENVGGRFAVLSPVGLVPAAFMGIVVDDIRKGARLALQEKDMIATLAASSIDSIQRKELVTLFWMYTQRLGQFGRWIQQLWAESLGKSEDRSGQKAPAISTPVPAVGPGDQHSILQQVMEGQRDKFIWFFRVGDAEDYGPELKQSSFSSTASIEGKGLGQLMAAEARATRDSLAEEGVHSLTLSTRELSPSTMGALFVLLEVVVAVMAESLNINAFDQPGVEKGKVLAKRYLDT